MPKDPQDAWKKAKTIGAAPEEWKQGEMPMPAPGRVLETLKKLYGGSGLTKALIEAPGAREGLRRAVPRTLGELDPYFTPVGAEAAHNATREAVRPLTDPTVAAYLRILEKGGR